MLSRDADFHRFHGIQAQTLVKLFARTKDRINPDRCSHHITSTTLDITLVKENDHGARWNQLEPDDYSKPLTYQPITTPTTVIVDTTSNIINSNRGKICSK